MKWLIGIGLLVGPTVINSAQAPRPSENNFVTVQELYQECRTGATDAVNAETAVSIAHNFGLCAGYIAGIGDMLAYTGRCPALNGATYGAMVQAFENWAPAHPQEWTKQQAEGVVAALSSAWSCGKSP